MVKYILPDFFSDIKAPSEVDNSTIYALIVLVAAAIATLKLISSRIVKRQRRRK